MFLQHDGWEPLAQALGFGIKSLLGVLGMADLRVTRRRGATEDDPDRRSETWRDLHPADEVGGRHTKVGRDVGQWSATAQGEKDGESLERREAWVQPFV